MAAHPRPTTIRDLQNFLGVINFYRKFVRGAAAILKPLSDILKGSPNCRAAVEWTPPRVAAFKAAKAALQRAASLAYPQQDAQLVLMVDASATHVGAALQQRTEAAWQRNANSPPKNHNASPHLIYSGINS